ncbi:MAG TPA: GNAT family N-acetyltransferase [Cytophagales bacterium]|nr:GNAT family N-acetyltransferase [Cytophagales bacterium]HAA24137.1 GNAT family N-acetyltransferase [Cytophagales bacterium]HAP63472.1 GNAT family N-acetyltransferase [Cytophagales bacterium]
MSIVSTSLPGIQLIIPQDATEILGMMEAFYALDDYPFDRDMAEQNLNKLLVEEYLGRLWLVQVGNKVAGYLALTFGFSLEYGGRDAFIDEIYLKDEFRGKGVGTHLIKQVSEAAKALGVRALHLEVEVHNIAGNNLYRKAGFQSSGRSLLSKRLT